MSVKIEGLKISKGRKEQFQPLMEMLVKCFRTVQADHPPLQEMFPDMYQPRSREMSHNLLAQKSGEIIGCVGTYPLSIVLGEKVIEIAGIGGVSTLPEYRGRGIMQVLMDETTESLYEQKKYSLAWLAGDRKRYRPWGYECVLNTEEVMLSSRAPDVNDFYHLQQWRVERREVKDVGWDKLWEQLVKVNYYAGCGKETLQLKYQRLNRDGMVIWQAEDKKENAHILASKDGKEIYAWAGDPTTVGVIVGRLLKDHNLSPQVWLPLVEDDYVKVFHRLASDFTIVLGGSLAIINLADMLMQFKEYLDMKISSLGLKGQALLIMQSNQKIPQQEVLLAADGNSLTVRENGTRSKNLPELNMSCWELVQMLFSVNYANGLMNRFTPNLRWLTMLGPIPVFVPKIYRA